jgi:hypothetical protein
LATASTSEGQPLVLLLEFLELLALQHKEFGIFERGRIVEARHLRKEGHTTEEVTAPVGQGVMVGRPRLRNSAA